MLTAAIALAQAPDGSRSLISGVMLQASELAQTLDIRRIIPCHPPTCRLFQGIGIVGLLVLPAIGSGTYRAWLNRQLAPWANLGRPGGFHVRIITATRVAARGQPLRIAAIAEPSRSLGSGTLVLPEMAWLEWIEDDGGRKSASPQRVPMSLERASREDRFLDNRRQDRFRENLTETVLGDYPGANRLAPVPRDRGP